MIENNNDDIKIKANRRRNYIDVHYSKIKNVRNSFCILFNLERKNNITSKSALF